MMLPVPVLIVQMLSLAGVLLVQVRIFFVDFRQYEKVHFYNWMNIVQPWTTF